MLNITKTFVFKLLYYFIWLLFGNGIKNQMFINYIMLCYQISNINKLILT